MTQRLVAAVDLGGTSFRAALIAPDGTLRARERARTPVERGPAAVLGEIDAAVREVVDDVGWPAVCALSLAVPGPVDPWTGIVRQAPNLPGWIEVDVRTYFAERVPVPVFVGNDANLAALGEQRYGAGRGTHHLIYLTVSTGVGGGVIVDDRLLLGAHGLAGELGHIVVDRQGPPCGCGGVGCLEQMASGTALARRAAAELRAGVASDRLRELDGQPEAVRAEHLAAWAEQGEPFARRLITEAATWLGVGVASFVHIFNPQMVVIGGGVSRMGDLLFEPLRAAVAIHVMPSFRAGLRIVPAALGDNAGLYGAAVWALDHLAQP
jgi:glucokinase